LITDFPTDGKDILTPKSTLDPGENEMTESALNCKASHRNMIEHIGNNGLVCAIIVRAEFREPGISFFTPDELSQQLAFMQHPAGKLIEPHVHNPVPRQVHYTQEVLVIRKGRLRVDFYDVDQEYLESRILGPGDVILLIQGGHGFEVLEDVEMIEVKQGPYVGEQDKTRFVGIDRCQVKLPGR
jgi:mannose-6-phosphate isomerase-like protein (cupin superfamily)